MFGQKNKVVIKKETEEQEIVFSNEEIKDEIIRKNLWKNRRLMAWGSWLYIFFSGLAPFYFQINEAYIPLITNTQFLCFGVVGAYIGGNVLEKIKLK